jgi:exonuclease III
MILLSLNIRGVGGLQKTTSFRRLLSLTHPDIIFLQETLVDSKKARHFLNIFFPTWYICTVSSLGTSGGLVVAWDPTKFDLSPHLCCGGICFLVLAASTTKGFTFLISMPPVLTDKISGKK